MTASRPSSGRLSRTRQLATFGAVSVATTLVDFGLFNVLIATGVIPTMANTVSYSVGILASYLLNKRLTFAGRGRASRSQEVVLFVVLNIGGLALNTGTVAITTWVVGEEAWLLNLAKLAAGAMTWLLKFVTFNRWVYPAQIRSGDPSRT